MIEEGISILEKVLGAKGESGQESNKMLWPTSKNFEAVFVRERCLSLWRKCIKRRWRHELTWIELVAKDTEIVRFNQAWCFTELTSDYGFPGVMQCLDLLNIYDAIDE